MLNSRLSENVQDIRKSYKIHHDSRNKLESEINSRKKNLADVKIQNSWRKR